VPGGDCPFTVAIKPKLHTAASSTVATARRRCDAIEILSATVFSSSRADAYRAAIAVDTLSSTPIRCSKNLAVYRGKRNSAGSRYAVPV
jgi:hypothetical protein